MPRTSALTVAARLKAAGLALADEAHPPGVTAVLAEDGAHHGRPGWVLVTVVTGPWPSALETVRRTLTPDDYAFVPAGDENTLLARRA